jgi:hypothetical protein
MGEMTGKENKGNITNIFSISQARDVTDLERRIPIGI